ncbi:MAG: orotidine 5'-phosphate decarboxylase / HUMPS family protein, partial [Pseudonocardiaceae bacterium]
MKAALASRHMGRVIRAYRTDPHHGRHPLPQEKLAVWLGLSQSKLSRIETGPRIEHLDVLIHIARVLRIPAQYLWFTLPHDHEVALDTALGRVGDDAELTYSRPEQTRVGGEVLGVRSAARTKVLLKAIQERTGARLRYVPPTEAVDCMTDFLNSSSRVYVIKGPPGCGKTRLMQYVASALAANADFQLHSVDSEGTQESNLAAAILQYASISTKDDHSLVLEQLSASLRKQFLVVVDGIKTQEQVNDIGRQLDGMLRHATTDTLKFLLVIRTPPDAEISTFPVLAASVYEPRAQARGASYWMLPWGISEARDAWNNSRGTGDPAFSDLPSSIQQLARVPLYMQLLKAAGHDVSPGEVNPYRLVDYCVLSILGALSQAGPGAEHAAEVLADLAQREVPDLVPAQLVARQAHQSRAESWDATYRSAVQLLVCTSSNGGLSFDHDVIREYFLANRIANLMMERGLSVATVGAFNELASRATTSAMARGVFDFVVCCLDRLAPDLVATVALSPTISVNTALPLMIRLASGHVVFATDEVVRACANRCSQDSALELARSILVAVRVVKALGNDYAPWIVRLLRRFGSRIWGDVALAIERDLDARSAGQLLKSADLDNAEAAAFFARYFFLFFGDDQSLTGSLEFLLAHPDWRVRAALAEGLRDEKLPHNAVAPVIMDRLAQDDDYKVRAAAAKAIGGTLPMDAKRHVSTLMLDDNWHVRESVLHGILSGRRGSASVGRLVSAAIDLLTSDDSWSSCPTHIAALMERLLLLHGPSGVRSESQPRQRALFALLRELRTGWIELPSDTQEALLANGSGSQSWLVQREAEVINGHKNCSARKVLPFGGPPSREAFRRLRDRRSVQIALDLHDLDLAVEVAQAAAAAGMDLIEVGDPLIKKVGIDAVEHIKNRVPQMTVVAEMMSADWGRDQVILAAEAGADVVFLIGPATTASVSAAVDAGRRLGVPIVLDVPIAHLSQQWIREMEHVG